MGVTDAAVCGLAKRLEEVWLPDQPYPVILPRQSEGLYLLQRFRSVKNLAATSVGEIAQVPGSGRRPPSTPPPHSA